MTCAVVKKDNDILHFFYASKDDIENIIIKIDDHNSIVDNKINALDLNAYRGIQTSGITILQGMRGCDGIATPQTNPTTGAISFTSNYHLIPSITSSKERINWKYGVLDYNSIFNTVAVVGTITPYQHDRIISIQYKLPYVLQTFRTTVQFLSIVELDLEEHDGISVPPDMELEDVIWDPDFYGGGTLGINKSGWELFWDAFGSLFSWVIWIVIIIIAIYVFIKIGVPLISARIQRGKKDTKKS